VVSRVRLTLALSLLALFAPAGVARAAVELVPLGSFDTPMQVVAAPGDATRMFVVEQAGRIQVAHPDGSRNVFLDVSRSISSGGERGLLSMAFAPDYATSGLFFIFYTGADGDLVIDKRRRADSDHADAGFVRPVLRIEHSSRPNHNGGLLQFGPDGLLYAATGDGGGAGDPDDNAQTRASLLGKLLRIAPAPGDGDGYTVPADNPFVDQPGAEVWSWGLRNPWRYSFDSLTGDLVIADVGQEEWEEIDFAPATLGGGRGVNWGWNCREGRHPFASAGDSCPAVGAVDPVLELSHRDGFCSITGGVVVRDPGLPSLVGRYLYGDLCKGRLRSARLGLPSGPEDREEPIDVASVVSFGTDNCHRVYVVSIAGPVSRLQEGPAGQCPASGDPTNPGGALGRIDPTKRTTLRADRRGPVARLGGRSRQRFKRRGVLVHARSDEAGSLTISGRVQIAGRRRSLKLRTERRAVASGQRIAVRLVASARNARRIRAALRDERTVRVHVRAWLRDHASNRSKTRRDVITLRP
jgi:hypothetical protein